MRDSPAEPDDVAAMPLLLFEYLLCESLGRRHLAADRLKRVGRHVERRVLVRVRRGQDRHRLQTKVYRVNRVE